MALLLLFHTIDIFWISTFQKRTGLTINSCIIIRVITVMRNKKDIQKRDRKLIDGAVLLILPKLKRI